VLHLVVQLHFVRENGHLSIGILNNVIELPEFFLANFVIELRLEGRHK